MNVDRLVREPERRAITGIPTSSWYDLIDRGLAPRAVRIGTCAAWPLSELATLNAARIAGSSEDKIRALVKRLVAARANALNDVAAA